MTNKMTLTERRASLALAMSPTNPAFDTWLALCLQHPELVGRQELWPDFRLLAGVGRQPGQLRSDYDWAYQF